MQQGVLAAHQGPYQQQHQAQQPLQPLQLLQEYRQAMVLSMLLEA
jgi:hypothetical protein